MNKLYFLIWKRILFKCPIEKPYFTITTKDFIVFLALSIKITLLFPGNQKFVSGQSKIINLLQLGIMAKTTKICF